MSATSSFVTKGYTKASWGKILDGNIHRKAILIGNSSADNVKFGFGTDSKEVDSVILRPGHVIKFDNMVPIDELWGKGALVIGEVS